MQAVHGPMPCTIGKNGFAGVYSANDGMASGAIAAMKGAGIDPTTRPITGGDGELAAIQRILAGQQYSTIYLTIKKQASVAAELAVALSQGKPLPASLINAQVKNGFKQVPSVLLTPVAVTKSNIRDTVIKDGVYTPAQICTGKYAADCKAAGMQSILTLMLARGIKQLALGMVLGLATAFAVCRLMSKLLFMVSPSDPITFVAVAFTLGAAGMAAVFFPARRAAKLDPLKALRYE